MFLRHLSVLPIRALAVLLAGLVLSLIVALDADRPDPADADPAFGTVKPAPNAPPFGGNIVLENHSFSLPVQITTCADATNAPLFTAESATTTSITDNDAAWSSNQWANYDIELTGGTGSPQWRTVTSNTANTLTVNSSWGGPVDTGTATGGSTTTIVDQGSGWLTNEFASDLGDGNPTFTVEFTGPEGPQTRTITGNTSDTLTVTPAFTTHVTETATGATSSTLVDATAWTANQWANKSVQITAGPASGQSRRILSNTATTLTIEGTWTTSAGGQATSGTTTTLEDAPQNWTVNAFAGMTVELLAGTGAPATALIASNTANTLTISGSFATAPAFGTTYRILQLPDATSQYIIRDGASINAAFQIKQTSPIPASGTKFQLYKSACRIGGYDITIGYNDTKLDVTDDGGISSGSNTVTTFNDTTKSWKENQWAGSRITITGGTAIGQTQIITANTKTRLTVTPGWNITPPNALPTTGSFYTIGGITDAGWIPNTAVRHNGTATSGSASTIAQTGAGWTTNAFAGMSVELRTGPGAPQTKTILSHTADTITISGSFSPAPAAGTTFRIVEGSRTFNCPGGQIFGPATAELHCVTFGASGTGLPQGPTGVGNLVNLSVTAVARGLATFTLTSQVLEVDGTTIPADTLNGSKRVILCPDSAVDGRVTSGDLLKIAQAFGQHVGDPLYTVTKDPDENGVISSGDQLATVAVFLQYCVQRVIAP
ncbi:MAG: hypothetical protein HY873_12440 [Chloroflexi bacterium]|nr:hypothetical protein [Chloroflexota bacterium]